MIHDFPIRGFPLLRFFALAAITNFLVGANQIASVHGAEPTFDPSVAIRAVVQVLERDHLSRKPLSDELSEQWLTAFLRALDPARMYFLDEDIAEFRASEKRFDDFAMAKDFHFPVLVRDRYRQRTAQAASMAEKFLSLEHDFSVDEQFPVRFERQARTSAELQERWRLRIKFELLLEKVHRVPAAESTAQLRGRYERIARQARDMTDERLCEIYLNALLKLYDPHSAYDGPSFLATRSGGLVRPFTLGIALRPKAGQFVIDWVRESLHNSAKESILGWHLLAIRRIDGTTIDLVEMHYADAINLIRWTSGPFQRDTSVILELVNPVTYERRSVEWPRFPA